MNRIKKAAGATSGGRAVRVTSTNNNQGQNQYSTSCEYSQYSTRAVGDLLDQALSRSEYHAQQAAYHAQQAEAHRRILKSLQSLIPTPQRGRGGAA